MVLWVSTNPATPLFFLCCSRVKVGSVATSAAASATGASGVVSETVEAHRRCVWSVFCQTRLRVAEICVEKLHDWQVEEESTAWALRVRRGAADVEATGDGELHRAEAVDDILGMRRMIGVLMVQPATTARCNWGCMGCPAGVVTGLAVAFAGADGATIIGQRAGDSRRAMESCRSKKSSPVLPVLHRSSCRPRHRPRSGSRGGCLAMWQPLNSLPIARRVLPSSC